MREFVKLVAREEIQIGKVDAAIRKAAEAHDILLPRPMNGETAV